MSKVTVNRRGPVGNAGRVTLSHLRAGETFRFPRSAPGTVYQMLAISNRTTQEGFESEEGVFMFANVANGQVYVAEDSRTVVPVDCSLTVRERVNVEPTRSRRTQSQPARSASGRGRSTSVRATKRRSRR
jgi:hypothetical protein